jgi:acyl transferase domain-containing protein/NAD(P)-dependent dehydrogenase (short-subunit alcohol dehydrogenase family)/acyl carrier protein
METTAHRAVAIVGVGAVLPDAPNASAFWENIKTGRYSVTEVDPQRWDPELYYDPDHSAPDKTYSKIGGWVREAAWEPMKWRMPVPPRVVDGMDGAQKWAIACTREALEDYGYPKRPLDPDRTAVILGNAMAGEKHYMTAMRIFFPEFARDLSEVSEFASLPESLRHDITSKLHDRMAKRLPEVTEDSMPGELANCIAGRIANLFNFHGPNFTCDAACASAMAAITSAVEGLVANHFDVAVTGGVDRNMGASTFVKFCKIGALSATGTRPYAEGADGFVMGEGCALFLMKRLADAERDGDKIYAVLRGMGASSDGKGKGITAPNPVGQRLAIERGWHNAGLSPATASYFEGHGTSTRVGDVVEAQSLMDVLSSHHLPQHSVGLGSVKSNFGHLKGAAGAAGLLKLTLALHHKVLPPSVNCETPSHEIDFAHSPVYVNTKLQPWTVPNNGVRRGGLSAFGFGGTNFHAVLEEYLPRHSNGNGNRSIAVNTTVPATNSPVMSAHAASVPAPVASAQQSVAPMPCKVPLRGALVIGADSAEAIAERLRKIIEEAKAGRAPAPTAPAEADLRAPERLAIDYAAATDLAERGTNALKALAANQPAIWKALRAQGIYRGRGVAGKVAFLYPGQGSQYVNMLKPLLSEPIVAETFAEADRVMTPLLGKALSQFIFVDQKDEAAVAGAENDLKQTAITQPAVLATDEALTRMLAAYGIKPDFTMGHSLGEYGALVAAEGLPFADALEAVSARGREMTRFSPEDKGLMAAVFAPIHEIERILKTISGYVVIANINSSRQAVIGGASDAVRRAMESLVRAGYEVTVLPVSHAFHTSIVASASEPLRRVLQRLHVAEPHLPVVANTNGEFYPKGDNVVPKMLDILAQQVASPVQFIKGLQTLYAAGARVFVEVGPKKALQGFAEDVLGPNGDVISLFTNHPKTGDIPAFNQALCCLYAAGLGRGVPAENAVRSALAAVEVAVPQTLEKIHAEADPKPIAVTETVPVKDSIPSSNGDHYVELGKLFAEALERAQRITGGEKRVEKQEPVTVTGAALGLPGTERIFHDSNVARILGGQQFIDAIPARFRQAMLDKHITRLVKNKDGGGNFETLTDVADVIKLAGRGGAFDLEKEFGISSDRCAALDRVTQLAMAVGLDAMRDAGIPLVLRYKTTSKGTQLPDHWMLPEALRDSTGVIFASCFPGLDSFSDETSRYHADRSRREQLSALQDVRARASNGDGNSTLARELDRHIEELRSTVEKQPYMFDRRFLFRVLPMGHSQFAELIGARGPNTAINAACASTTQAVAVAEDWIRAGRCRRVIVVAADDITSDHLIEWMGAGFLASGAAATDESVEEAAVPFDRRRHGMIIGMGAAGLIIESAEAARERGIQPICEVLSAVTANSAFHGTRLDMNHIGQVMEQLLSKAEARNGIKRDEIASKTVLVSHETYTPARGGSAQAEIHALRRVFGHSADQIVIANTKGFTGHAMGAGIEDVLAIKALETGVIPPIANFKEVDPDLGELNLSKGGAYPVEYALRLGAGFGSQISMTLLHWVGKKDKAHQPVNSLGYAYRISDPATWQQWLSGLNGHANPDLEVVNRTLRVRDQQMASKTEAASLKVTPQPARTPADITIAGPLQKPVAVAVAAKASTPVELAPPAPKTQTPEPKVEREPVIAVPASRATAETGVSRPQTLESVRERIVALAVEKTGYPKDMMDLDLDLEADLGVDTVKQAEMFAAIREIYNIPRDENRKLRDYPTLGHVIRFVLEKRPDMVATPVPAVGIETNFATPASAVETKATKEQVLAAAPSTTVVQTPTAMETGEEAVKQRILALAVEKTGYPKEMLDLDLDLEADLGVDTVKQAEMFAAIREIYNIPRDENRKLRDYPTLAHVIRFVLDKRPDLAAASVASAQPASPTTPSIEKAEVLSAPAQPATTTASGANQSESVKERILALAVEKTGYPKDMLDLDLDLEADLGVDTVKQAEMFAAIREIYNIPRDENRKLRDYPTLAHVIRFVLEKRPDLAGVTAPAQSSHATTTIIEQAPEVASMPTTAAPVAAAVGSGVDQSELVKERILALAVEKTGYPKDMLDLDLDLEADLGVDTVKQAEMFAAMREIYGIPRDENRKLRDYPTLAHVIRFVLENRPNLAGKAMGLVAPPVTPVAAVVISTGENSEAAQPVSTASAQTLEPPFDSQASIRDSIKEKVMEIVAAKTGYPKDMLDIELDLEADLGIDTVKQAEMFAAIRSTYNIPRDENLKLRDFPTLAHVIKFAQDRSGLLISQAAAQPESAPPVHTPEASPMVAASRTLRPTAGLEAANQIPRRVPVPVLRPPLSMCKRTGVNLDRGRRIVIMSDQGGVGERLADLLKKKEVEVLQIVGSPDAETLTAQLKTWLAAGSIDGIYWLPALDQEGALNDMELATWREALRVRVKLLYSATRALYSQVEKPGTFLISATRFGGQHGYDAEGAVAPLGGAVSGFTKTFKRERPEALVKAVDFEGAARPGDIASALIEETLRDPGAVEIGYKDALRWTIGLEEQSTEDKTPWLQLDDKTVFVVTGAAGSIVSAITADLAVASAGTFYLLDLVSKPDPANPDLQKFVSDKDGLKRDLFARIQARGERATPALVEKELAALERAHAAQSAIDAVRAAGGTAYYHSVNLTDAKAVVEIVDDIRHQSGRIDVLLHAAGIERSHFLPEKDPREFDLVFDVKSDGFFNLMHAIGDMPLRSIVSFSSIAGRFGNAGQADYSAANDLLCKFTSNFRKTRPETRAIVIDWGAWGGIGMASRGSIPKIMEAAGIEMLPPESAIPVIRRELVSGSTRGEVVIAKKVGVLLQEWDETGGLDAAAIPAGKFPSTEGPMVGKIAKTGLFTPLTVETTIDPKVQPYLFDHKIDDIPVLPGVMGLEAFAEAALALLPGWNIEAIEDVEFFAPFKFYHNKPRTVTVEAIVHPIDGGLVADCKLIGRRSLPNQTEPTVTTHFTARVRLTKEPRVAASPAKPRTPVKDAITSDDIYRLYFHGPTYQVVEKAWRDGDRVVGLMTKNLPNNHFPAEQPTVAAPRLIELCFQTSGVWEMGSQGLMGLPKHIDKLSFLGARELTTERLYAVVTPSARKGFDAEVVDGQGNCYLRMMGYDTAPFITVVDSDRLKPLKAPSAIGPVAA